MLNSILDNHAAYNKFIVMGGFSKSENTTQPSEYITFIKVKKLFSKLTKEEIENLFDKEMNLIALARHREKLLQKLESLQKWQLFRAFKITEDYIYQAAVYILGCKRLDKEEESNNQPNI